MHNLVFDPLIPFALWCPLALAAATLWAWYATAARQRLPRKRRWLILGLMAAGAAVPLIVLLNPTWLQRVPPPAGKPRLTVLVDTSASMATPDATGGVSRHACAARLAADTSRALAERYEIRLRTFADSWAAASPDDVERREPVGAVTDLAAAIGESLDEAQVQGQAVLLLSDGGHNAPGGGRRVLDVASKAQALAAPIFTHTVGGPAGVRDVEVALQLPQELAFVRQQVPVIATVRQRGSLAARVRVSLERTHGHGQRPRPDAPGPPGETVDTRDVPLHPDGEAEIVFHVTQEQSGLYRYEVRADPLPGEVTTVNNSATLLLRVVDQPVRVLLLEGKPYWDTKFLIRTLTADQSIELVSVVKLAENRLLQRTLARPEANTAAPPAAAGEDTPAKRDATDAHLVRPTDWSIQQDAGRWLADRQTLAKYQIVILGRDAEAFLNDDALRQLKQWLTEDSGALVCYRGPPASQISQRLGELLPVRWAPSSETRFRVQLTTEGRSLRWLPSSDGAEDPLA
ncbi:MAG: hypothetical protein FJ276_10605, partial [Planctomycetes bacterium]|nr:hypothetical protein [Planctomycetota bacterium]